MSGIEQKANLFGAHIRKQYDKKRGCLFRCIVSPSGQVCQIQARVGGETLSKQTIPWSHLEAIRVDEVADYGNTILKQIGLLLDFA